MKFLDLNGLTHFFDKVKTWAGNNYLSLKGGSIDGSVVINNEEAVALRVLDGSSYSDKEVAISPTRITMSYADEDQGGGSSIVYNLDIQDGNITANSFTRIGGTATQVLIANGSVREIGSANGVAGLDSKGYVPLAQLGNLDTTVAEVVTALPTTNIKKHIYLIKDTDGVTQNQYEEYIYTGDTSATYDASKWEKLGDFRATVDLADYAKRKEIVDAFSIGTQPTDQGKQRQFISINFPNGEASEISILEATTNMPGLMSYSDKSKLLNIESGANNYSLPLAANGTRGGIQVGYAANGRNYPVQLSGEKAYVNVPWTDTNTTYSLATSTNDGLMSKGDKNKLDKFNTSKVTIAQIDVSKIISDISILPDVDRVEIRIRDTNGNYKPSGHIESATEDDAGVMSVADKIKLNSIATGATADSAITTAEIDALFT